MFVTGPVQLLNRGELAHGDRSDRRRDDLDCDAVSGAARVGPNVCAPGTRPGHEAVPAGKSKIHDTFLSEASEPALQPYG